ncbi:DUF4194 domain-containing protein [Acholeplasma laidlawii]|nr:DUF4194 domain-containing protein [Acholeplasma laidlawii]NWH10377.1 DUF4194 domain-containing protein [Acholeplasma laidlawii]NWH11765.1 DUF4194 domain-containing protein [Acholeplasma laidlawii]NWH12827.1 DUF4194 domain-containing protein [Acholeplasma laidlawii]NWH14359.1 DUF4194 domain-containing protein [Acholeplasma laidlawii]OED26986.1 hypothetical protein A9269_05670 [Acholeplasma laidlawii]
MMNKNQAIKKLSEEFVVLKEAEKTVFSRIVNKLLQVNFITRKKIADANDYRFVLAYKEIFEAYFCLSDFELIIERHEEVLYIKNISNFNHLRLRKAESILLLIIRMLYQSKMNVITLDENVEIYLSEVHDELTKVGYLDNKRMTKETLKPSLQLLKSYNIIDYMDSKLNDDARIKIYPTILYVIRTDSIKELLDHIDDYVKGGNVNEEVDED